MCLGIHPLLKMNQNNDSSVKVKSFKRGFMREDGMVFWGVVKGMEQWITPDKLNELRAKARLAMIEWRKKNPEKPRAWAKSYRLRNPEKAKQSYRNSILKNPAKYREKSRRWAIKNPEKIKEAARKTYLRLKAKNPEGLRLKRLKAYQKQKLKNPELLRQRLRNWQRNNASKVTAYVQAREALKNSATPSDAQLAFVQINYQIAERLSRCLGIKHQVDHIFPLSKGGSHCHRNLQVIPSRLNQIKNSKTEAVLPSCYRSDGWSATSGIVHLTTPPKETTA